MVHSLPQQLPLDLKQLLELIELLQELLVHQMTLVLLQGLEPLEHQLLGLLELQHLLQLKEP